MPKHVFHIFIYTENDIESDKNIQIISSYYKTHQNYIFNRRRNVFQKPILFKSRHSFESAFSVFLFQWPGWKLSLKLFPPVPFLAAFRHYPLDGPSKTTSYHNFVFALLLRSGRRRQYHYRWIRRKCLG